LAAFNRKAKRDFLRLAVALWITPDFAALSNAELSPWSALVASSFLPEETSDKYPLSRVCNRDFVLRLRNSFLALFRMRRSADFVFGIDSDYFSNIERATLMDTFRLSTENPR
jgi:hypothetical protein